MAGYPHENNFQSADSGRILHRVCISVEYRRLERMSDIFNPDDFRCAHFVSAVSLSVSRRRRY